MRLTSRLVLVTGIICLFFSASVFASPYGAGMYGENVPYGGETSLTISTDGNVTIPITPNDAGEEATANNVVTVVSTDVIGYKLYIRATATALDHGGGYTIPAVGAPGALSVNTWGYNTDAGASYTGVTILDVLILDALIPYPSGNITTVTYGVKVDNTKPAGNYTTTVIYTAVPQTQ